MEDPNCANKFELETQEDMGSTVDVAETFSAMSLKKGGHMTVMLPFWMLQYKDRKLFKYVRLDILLLFQTTMKCLIYNVDKYGCYFTIKYILPDFWMIADIVDEQDNQWDSLSTYIQEAYQQDITLL